MASAVIYPTLFEWMKSFNNADNMSEEQIQLEKDKLCAILGVKK